MPLSATSTTLWVLATLAASLWLMEQLQVVIAPLIVAWFLAYAVNPLVEKLGRWKMPRWAAILVVFTGLALLVTLAVVLMVPALSAQVRTVARVLPDYAQRAREWLVPRIATLTGHPVENDAAGWAATFKSLQDAMPSLAGELGRALQKGFANVWSFVRVLVGLTVIPLFAFFLLLDFQGLGRKAIALLPMRAQGVAERILIRADDALAGFIRGQLIACLVLAVVYSVGLTLSGIDMPWVVGILSGALYVIPYLGALTGFVLASLLALLKFHDLPHFLAVCATFGAGQALDALFLTPRVVGHHAGLTPLTVIVALLVGGQLFGFIGILLAVPVAAVLRVGASEVLGVYRRSRVYQGREG